MKKRQKRQSLLTQNVKMLLNGVALCQQCLKAVFELYFAAAPSHKGLCTSNSVKTLALDLQCSVQTAKAMQRDMEKRQQLFSSLQRQLDGLQQDLHTKQAQIDQQHRLAAAAKQAEQRHGQRYHTYMKQAMVTLYCHRQLAVIRLLSI